MNRDYLRAYTNGRPDQELYERRPVCPLCKAPGQQLFISFDCSGAGCPNNQGGKDMGPVEPKRGTLAWARLKARQFEDGQIYGTIWERRFPKLPDPAWRADHPGSIMYDYYEEDATEWRYRI